MGCTESKSRAPARPRLTIQERELAEAARIAKSRGETKEVTLLRREPRNFDLDVFNEFPEEGRDSLGAESAQYSPRYHHHQHGKRLTPTSRGYSSSNSEFDDQHRQRRSKEDASYEKEVEEAFRRGEGPQVVMSKKQRERQAKQAGRLGVTKGPTATPKGIDLQVRNFLSFKSGSQGSEVSTFTDESASSSVEMSFRDKDPTVAEQVAAAPVPGPVVARSPRSTLRSPGAVLGQVKTPRNGVPNTFSSSPCSIGIGVADGEYRDDPLGDLGLMKRATQVYNPLDVASSSFDERSSTASQHSMFSSRSN